jgi:hypothetical protein
MINFRTSYVASCKAKGIEQLKARSSFRVAKMQKNGKLSACNPRSDLFETEADAMRMAALRMEWNQGATFVVVPA